MKKHRLIGLAALLALATGCSKDVADRISLFANSMGGGAKVWMNPTDVNSATWVAGERINLNGTSYAITANRNGRFSLEVEPLAEAMYAVYPATMASGGNDITVVNNGASGADTITIKSLVVDFRDGGHRIVFPMAAQAAAESGSLFFDHLTAGLRLTLENSANSGYAIDHLKVVVQGTAAAGDVEIGGVSYTVAWAVQGPTTPSGGIGGIEDDRPVDYSSEMNFHMQTNGVAGVTVPARANEVNGSISFCVPVTVCEMQRISITGYDASGVQLFTKSKSIDSDRPNLEVNHMYHIQAFTIN